MLLSCLFPGFGCEVWSLGLKVESWGVYGLGVWGFWVQHAVKVLCHLGDPAGDGQHGRRGRWFVMLLAGRFAEIRHVRPMKPDGQSEGTAP